MEDEMQVVQVYPMENYDVAVYFADGNIKKYNADCIRPLCWLITTTGRPVLVSSMS